MILRLSRGLLVAAIAIYYTLVVFNNLTDYGSNYEFVHHVLLMDSTFPGNHGMWRAIHSPWVYTAFYDGIIVWEAVAMALTWAGAVQLLRTGEKQVAVLGLTAGMLLWLTAFLTVGGEWFLMWQSHTWNGQEAAFRMFVVLGVVMGLVLMPEGGGGVKG
jgi:predicted small integral membrane protein